MIVLFVTATTGYSDLDYDINVTKEQLEKTTAGLPEYFKFTIIGEDTSTGSLRIKYKKTEFEYNCKNEAASPFGKTFRCKYVFGDGKEAYWFDDFPTVLWFIRQGVDIIY